MKVDELIGELVRLGAVSPHGGETVVLLRFEGDLEIEGAKLGRAQLPRGRTVKSPVVLLQAQIVHRAASARSLPGRADQSGGESEGSKDQPDHAEMIWIQLCRAIAKKIKQDAGTGDQSRALEHLYRLIETERFGLRRRDSDAGQLWLSQDQTQADFARALAICEASGASVIHSGPQAVYNRTDDKITIPIQKRFPNPAAYFNTRFHETAHWAEKRVDWEGSRAEGELIAVLASYHLAEAADIPVVDIGQYWDYHEAWLRAIRSDAGFLTRMLNQAFKVAHFILASAGERTR